MSRRAQAAMVLVLMFGLGGCAVDQAKDVARYRQVLDEKVTPVEHLKPGEPLTLTRALHLANLDNESLGIQGETYVQALLDKQRALGTFLPTISFAPVYYNADPTNTPGVPDHYMDVPFQTGYTNFNAFNSAAAFKKSAYTIEQRRWLLLDLRSTVMLNTVLAYYAVLRSERQVEVLRNSLAVQEERVRDVEAQNKAGTARPLDVAQARAQAASTLVALKQAEGDVRNGRSALAFVIAQAVVDGPLVDDFAATRKPGTSANELIEFALDHRLDVRAAKEASVASLHGVDAAIAEYYPSVSANLSTFAYRESVPDASIYTALIQANIPIFTAGKIHADVQTAWSYFRQAKLNESLIRRQVRNDVQTAYQNIQTSLTKLSALETQVAAAQEEFNQASDLVKFGRATNLDRIVAQDQLLTAQLNFTNEQFTLKSGFLSLQRVTGALTTDPNDPVTTTQPATTQPTTKPTDISSEEWWGLFKW